MSEPGTGERTRTSLRPGWWLDAVLVAAFALLTWVLWRGHLLFIDVDVRDWCLDHQPAVLHWAARVGNELGQGTPLTVLCGLIALYLAYKHRSFRPLGPVVLAFALTFVILTILKDWTDRAAPKAFEDTPPILHPERFGSGGVSYPSGHLANSIVWYGVLALLLSAWLAPRWSWWIRIVPPVVLTITTVYLAFHWLSDTITGILLGLVLWRIIRRVPWRMPWLPSADRRPASVDQST